MPRLEHHFLGPFRVTLGGEPLTGFATDKVRALLAYLAVEGKQAHRREALAGLLWPNYPDSDALTSLRQALRKLRQALALSSAEATKSQTTHDGPSELLLITPQTVQFEPGGDYLDVDEFRGLVKDCHEHRHRKVEHCSTCHARLRRAAELYRGDFLAGFLLEDSEPFDEWVVLTREGLRRQALEVFAHLALYHETRSEHEQALQYSYRQIEMEPWREDVHRQAMRLLAITGQRSAAIAQYEYCRRMLLQDLGIEPEAATVTLYERIKTSRQESEVTGQGALRATKSQNGIPQQLAAFVGREEELREIAERLDSAECRLMTLVGPGGVGKTRLAIEVATRQIGAFDDGVWFVPLSTANTSELLVLSIAHAIGLRFDAAGEQPDMQLLDYLRDKEMLLVLDNFEQLLDGGGGGGGSGSGIGMLMSIIKNTQQITMLVTSRERLGLQAEYMFDLEGLRLPGGDVALMESSAVQLFVEQARHVERQFTLSSDNAQDVVNICRLVVGLPLGIVLAAAWVRQFPPARIATSIQENLDFLASSSRDASPQHSSLRAVFNHSWNLLSEEERRVFRRLSVFRGGWEEKAAEMVAGASLQLLFSLADKSLLRSASERYDMHEVLRQYAAEQLELVSGERSETLVHHATYFLELSEQAEEQLRGSMQSDWLQRLEEEHDNIRAALRWARGEDGGQGSGIEVGLRIAGALWRFWIVRGYLSEGREQLAGMLRVASGQWPELGEAPEPVSTQSLPANAPDIPHSPVLAGAIQATGHSSVATFIAKALNAAGGLASSQGDYATARSMHEESLAIRRELRDTEGIASSLNNLGLVADDQGDFASARSLHEESLAMLRELGDKWGISYALANLGSVTYSQGDYATARSMYEESLAMLRELGDKWGITIVLLNLGHVAYSQRDYATARSTYEESLAMLRELGDKRGCAECLAGLGGVAAGMGQAQAQTQAEWHAERGARLLGAAEALLEAIGAVLGAEGRMVYEQQVASARAQLSEEEFEKAWAEGRAMSMEAAIEYALEQSSTV